MLPTQSAGKLSEFEALLVEVEGAEDPGDACRKLQDLVNSVRPDSAILKKAGVIQLPSCTASNVKGS